MTRVRPGLTHLGAVFLLLAVVLWILGHSVLGVRGLETIGFFLLAIVMVGAGEAWFGAPPGRLDVSFGGPVRAGEDSRALFRLEYLGGAGWGGATLACAPPGGRKLTRRVQPGGRDLGREGSLGSWRFPRRGRQAGVPVSLTWEDPVGVARRTRTDVLPQELLVLPKRVEVDSRAAAAGGRGLPFASEEGAPVMREGSSQDFLGVRPYEAGDSLRHIHWRSTAKTGEYMVTQFHHLEGVGAWIALAGKGWAEGGAGPGRWEDGVAIAAGWAETWAKAGGPVGLWVEGAPASTVFPAEGADALQRILASLADLPANPPAEGSAGGSPEGRSLWVLPGPRVVPSGHVAIEVPARPLPHGPSKVVWTEASPGRFGVTEVMPL